MKICTITCHDVYNYGASLQAYALQTFLQDKGHKVEVIDYKPVYKNFFNVFSINKEGFLYSISCVIPVATPLLALLQHRTLLKKIPSILKFKWFKKRYLNCTRYTYRNIDELITKKPDADIFIAGSDQIWNTAFQNGLDPAYYCLFERDTKKCISYAASFGISEIPTEHQDFVRKGLEHFRSISVREFSGVSIVNSLGYKAVCVMDPVFLLDRDYWVSLVSKKHNDKYLLIYDFSRNDETVKKVALKIAKERNLHVYSFNTVGDYIEKTLYCSGPLDFLKWIFSADMIISNSFHATAFSIIFNKDFYTLPLHRCSNSSRMQNLLSLLSLNNRFVLDETQVLPMEHIDYSVVLPALSEEQAMSRKWLMESLCMKN